uniref:X8 domain-containing protein n=1 Tax=Nelumbo nucifera TaxID=4432 RepID=A0A822YKE5_NELNU|nr:TPA_asm: hypothetical protein HUJ06_011828 [Nelumbo nucifera]
MSLLLFITVTFPWLTVSSSVVSNAVDVSEFSSTIMRYIESNTEAKGSVSGLFAQISPMVKSEKKQLNNEEEQMLASSHKLHDMKQKPISTRTTLYEHDVISSPAATLPTNPTPTIVTVPSTNPVTITPTNPATTPVTVPSTTPVTVPSVNPVNPPATVPITNPVTTPITTPSPTTPIITNPVTTYPVSPPGSIPVTTPVTTPTTNPAAPATTGAPIIPGQSWCIAKSGILQNALQNALDYACGIGGADCSAIQPTESCYNPNTLQNHASYAFNSYFQKNPVPSSCDFGGTAVIVNTNPSIGSCVYPSTSTPTSSSSSSLSSPPATSSNSPAPVFGTSNPATATTIFGTQPPPGSSTSVSISVTLQPQVGYIILVMPIIFVTLTMRM